MAERQSGVGLGLFAVGVIVVIGLLGKGDRPPKASAPAPLSSTSTTAVPAMPAVPSMFVAGRQLVRAALRDPRSADFRNDRERGAVLCGEVNAKNGFGGYTGYRRFVASRSTVLFEGDGSDFSGAWRKFCN